MGKKKEKALFDALQGIQNDLLTVWVWLDDLLGTINNIVVACQEKGEIPEYEPASKWWHDSLKENAPDNKPEA